MEKLLLYLLHSKNSTFLVCSPKFEICMKIKQECKGQLFSVQVLSRPLPVLSSTGLSHLLLLVKCKGVKPIAGFTFGIFWYASNLWCEQRNRT